MMTELDYDALQRLADAATPGPWEHHRTVQADHYVTAGGGLLTGAIVCGSTYERHNTEFIAASRSAVPALLDRVRELEAALANARTHRSLPYGCVWNDYYSPDEVIRIREPLEAERDAALSTIAKVEALADEVIAVHGDRIGTHYADCYKNHVACLAVTIRHRALGSVPSTGEGNE